MVEAVAAQQELPLEAFPLPWKRCLRDVASGEMAGAIGASFSQERASFAVYPMLSNGSLDASRRIQISSYSLYRLKGTQAGWDGKQFSQLTTPIVAQLGYSVVADLGRLGVAVDQSPGTAETVMKKLLAGRGQLAALLTLDGEELLEIPRFGSKIERVATPLAVKPYFLIFNKQFYADNKSLVETLWNGLAAARVLAESAPTTRPKVKP